MDSMGRKISRKKNMDELLATIQSEAETEEEGQWILEFY